MSFKTAIQEYGKEITASFVCGGRRYADEQIVSFTPSFEGKLFASVMRCLEIQVEGVKELIAAGTAVAGEAVAGVAVAGATETAKDLTTLTEVKFGVKAPGDTDYSYKEYGTYIIHEQKYDDEVSALNMTCYDLMLLSMIPYDLALDFSTGAVTVKTLLDAICNRLGWTIGYTTFTNSNVVIDGEKFDSTYTFRDVLDKIAEVAAGVIAFKGDALCVLYPTSTGEIIDPSNLSSVTIGEKFGPINSVVLARTPQEDNIFAQDANSVAADGLTEIRFENNEIMDSNRDAFISGIFARLNGLQFYLYDLTSFGIGHLDLCDMFTLETMDGERYETIMLVDQLQVTQALSETSSLEAPEATETDYTAASSTDRLLNKTILKVDKQAQEITALVTRTDTVEGKLNGVDETVTKMASVMMDAEGVRIKIEEAVGDIDSITTSTGYTFDKDGLKISKSGEGIENKLDNKGMFVTNNGEEVLTADDKGVNAVNLTSRQYLIVGNNARFENYDDGTDSKRTACFYIGG